MAVNFYMFFVAALIPMALGALYYSDMVFGKAISKINGVSDDNMKKGHPPLTYIIAYVFCCFIAFSK